MKMHEKIKWAREKMGWSLVALAKETGLSFIRLLGAETDMNGISMSELTKIADALQRPVDWFLSEDEPDDPVCLHCKESKDA